MRRARHRPSSIEAENIHGSQSMVAPGSVIAIVRRTSSHTLDTVSVSNVYTFPNGFFDDLRCPLCTGRLSNLRLIDPYLHGLICAQGHRFYVPLRDNTADITATAHESPLFDAVSQSTSDIPLWMSEPSIRQVLNGQIAIISRRLYEICELSISIPHIDEIFLHCPLCSETLEHSKIDGGWSRPMNCTNGHQFFVRNGATMRHGQGAISIVDDMSNQNVLFAINAWLKGDACLESNLPPRVKALLRHSIDAVNICAL